MSVETVGRKVQAHFHADAQRFDAIYEEEKSAFARWVDTVGVASSNGGWNWRNRCLIRSKAKP